MQTLAIFKVCCSTQDDIKPINGYVVWLGRTLSSQYQTTEVRIFKRRFLDNLKHDRQVNIWLSSKEIYTITRSLNGFR